MLLSLRGPLVPLTSSGIPNGVGGESPLVFPSQHLSSGLHPSPLLTSPLLTQHRLTQHRLSVPGPLDSSRGSVWTGRKLVRPCAGLCTTYMAVGTGPGSTQEASGMPVVITGVTRGLGRALALEMARRGHPVAGCGRDPAGLESLEKEMPGEGHFFMPTDVAVDSQVKKFVDEAVAKLGVPKFVVNCAGIINRNKRLWEVEEEEFNAVMSINVNGTANVIRHATPHLLQARHGAIVNFSSGWGRSAAAEVAPYCASKWAIEGLTKALAKELPDGVIAVALNPGVVETDMLRSCFGSSASLYGGPDDWAPLCADIILRLGPKDNGAALTV